MTSTRKFFKTEFTITLLHEDEIGDCLSVESVAGAMQEGDCSGCMAQHESVPLTGEEMAKALVDQGSDPAFLGLTEDGDDV